jgi:fucose permease
MGVIFSFYFGGFMLGSFLSSWIVNYFSRKVLLLISYLVISGAVFSLAFTANFAHIATSFFLIGLCGGFLESQITTLMIDLNKKNEGLYVNLSQVFFGIGAFIGPMITALIIGNEIHWKYTFIIAGVLCLLNFIFFLFIDISHLEMEKIKSTANIFSSGGLKNKSIFIILIFAMFFYVCSEIGLAAYIPTFLRLEKGFTDVFAAQVLSYFWLSSIFGRVVIGFLTKKIKILYILLGITLLSILSIIGGIYFKNNILIITSFILTGIFLSGIWPLIVTEGGLQYPYRRNFVVAIIIFFGGLGGLSAPLLISTIYDSSGLLTAMNLNYIFLILVFLFILALVSINRKAYDTKKD